MVIIPCFATGQTVADPFPRTISVSGSAELSVIPDEIYVSVRLKEYVSKRDGKQDLPKIKAGFLAACRAVKIPDSAVSVAEFEGGSSNWYWKRKARTQPDLLAEIEYEVMLSSMDKLDLLEEKLDEQATVSFSIQRVAHSKASIYRRQLKIDAVKAAKEKARYLAESIGERVGPAITISEPSERYYGNTSGIMLSNTVSQSSNRISSQRAASEGEEGRGSDMRRIRYRYEVSAVFTLQ